MVQEDPFSIAGEPEYRVPSMLQNSVTIQGKFVEIKGLRPHGNPPPPGTRKPITEFSRKARLRLLKLIAKIDWSRLPHGMFITLTYPDECLPFSIRQATMQRSHFIRKLEKHLTGKVPILWRKELKDRQSGRHRGKLVSHWHLSVFSDKRIDAAVMNDWWRKEIKWPWEIQCHWRPLDSGEHAAFYLAKYLSKQVQEVLLDYQPNLTNPGRAYGITRKTLLPMHEITYMEEIPPLQWAEIMGEAERIWNDESFASLTNFTMLGVSAMDMAKKIIEVLT